MAVLLLFQEKTEILPTSEMPQFLKLGAADTTLRFLSLFILNLSVTL